mmetsp:Transcript_7604/g.27828  ORF Transcript_7604/g.27828 Transcript_7604/m.27828 type:complete len:286 (+) Transcript_7604:6893-7750(+)
MTHVLKCAATFATYCYASLVGFLWIAQRRFQYFPSRESPPSICSLPSVFQQICTFEVLTTDKLRLKGWLWSRELNGALSHIFILHLHGNAGSRLHRLDWAYRVRTRFGCTVALFDYRGYGGNDGYVSEDGLIEDAVAAITWAHNQALKTHQKLVLHLESIGSAAGINALMRTPTEIRISGIVSEGGLSSCSDLAKNVFGYLPIELLMKDKWCNTLSSAKCLSRNTHFLSLHGQNDSIVPLWSGRRLYEAVNCEKKIFHEFGEGGHNDLMYQPSYFATLEKFFKSL